MSTTTLDIVVDKVISRDQLSNREYARLFDLAVDGYKEIFRRVLPDYKTVFLHWDDTDRRFIKFPQDYDSYLIVGIAVTMPSGNRSILTLSRNDYLLFDEPVVCDCTCSGNQVVEAVTIDNNITLLQQGLCPFGEQWYFGAGFRDGQYVGEYYGLGGGQSFAGSFTVDNINKRFVFGTDVPTDQEIVLRYTPTAVNYDGQSIKGIPDMAEAALIRYVQWARLNLRNSGRGDRDEAEYRYRDERNNLSVQINKMTESEVMDAVFEGLTFSISR